MLCGAALCVTRRSGRHCVPTVCTLPWHGMMEYDIDPSGRLVNRTGLGFMIMDTLADALGFS